LIDRLPSLLNEAIQFYSCFISYSNKDQAFANRLYADLQNNSVRCWFAPHDMPIGAKIIDALDEAIRLRDKLLLILSDAAITSDWVEDEVTTAFEEERRRGGGLTPAQRKDFFLPPEPPLWCIELKKWPYHTDEWKQWLSDTRAGKNPSLPAAE